MGLGDEVSSKDQKGGFVFIASVVSCSICLEAVTDSDDRWMAKLQCGHEFHLGGASCQASFRGNCREDGEQLRKVFWRPKKSGVFWIYKVFFHSERFTSPSSENYSTLPSFPITIFRRIRSSSQHKHQ